MIGCSVKHVIKKPQGKIHEWLQCKSRIFKNVVKNTLIGFSGKNMLKKFSGKCMKSIKMRIFHFQCKKRSGIRSLPSPHLPFQSRQWQTFFIILRDLLQTKLNKEILRICAQENIVYCCSSCIAVCTKKCSLYYKVKILSHE